jgi:hypothetical protein
MVQKKRFRIMRLDIIGYMFGHSVKVVNPVIKGTVGGKRFKQSDVSAYIMTEGLFKQQSGHFPAVRRAGLPFVTGFEQVSLNSWVLMAVS